MQVFTHSIAGTVAGKMRARPSLCGLENATQESLESQLGLHVNPEKFKKDPDGLSGSKLTMDGIQSLWSHFSGLDFGGDNHKHYPQQ